MLPHQLFIEISQKMTNCKKSSDLCVGSQCSHVCEAVPLLGCLVTHSHFKSLQSWQENKNSLVTTRATEPNDLNINQYSTATPLTPPQVQEKSWRQTFLAY